jgi:hypothetical protein
LSRARSPKKSATTSATAQTASTRTGWRMDSRAIALMRAVPRTPSHSLYTFPQPIQG